MNDNWVKIFADADFLKVELAQNVLEENNIESYIMDHSDSALTHLGDVQLFTPQEVAVKAKDLLKSKGFA